VPVADPNANVEMPARHNPNETNGCGGRLHSRQCGEVGTGHAFPNLETRRDAASMIDVADAAVDVASRRVCGLNAHGRGGKQSGQDDNGPWSEL
jgi:hypothetical protein